MNPPIKVIIADDHEMLLDGLMEILKNQPDIEVVGKALDGRQLLDMLRHKTVDLVVMDIEMPGMDGVEATAALKRMYPGVKVLVLTMYNTPEFVANLLRHGADGYLLKNTRAPELVKGIREVAGGKPYFTQEVMQIVMGSFRSKDAGEVSPEVLSDREREIICLIVAEHTSREIAEKLFLSFHTVEKHRKNIIAKLGPKNVAGLVKFALEHRLCKD